MVRINIDGISGPGDLGEKGRLVCMSVLAALALTPVDGSAIDACLLISITAGMCADVMEKCEVEEWSEKSHAMVTTCDYSYLDEMADKVTDRLKAKGVIVGN